MSKKPYGLELYINNLILQLNELYPNIITEDQKEKVYLKFKDDPRIKTVEGYEEIKIIISGLFEHFINKYYNANSIKNYNPARWTDMKPNEEVKELYDTLEVLKEYGEHPIKIIDAGCGNGRNAIFLAQKGYDVAAIDVDEILIKNLEYSKIEYKVPDLKAFRINIIDYLKSQPDNSIDAIIDSGMSHYLNDETKYLYYQLAKRKIKPGGLYSILHYGEFEGDRNIGRSLNDLKKLTLGSESVIPWKEKTWLSDSENIKIIAYSSLLRKAGGNIPTETIKYMLWLKENTENYEPISTNSFKRGMTTSKIIILIVLLIIITFLSIILFIKL